MKTETKYLIDQYHLSDNITWHQINTLIPKNQLVYHIDEFLSNLKGNHELPGKIHFKLQDIGHWIRQHEIVTPKQHRFVTLAIIGYWNELKDEYRHYI